MSQLELLSAIIAALDELQIDHMLVGSHASSFYGEARSTHDIDLVIDLDPAKIADLVSRFEPDRYYFSEAALREGRMANLIDTHTGDKVDCFILDDDPWNRRAFSRRSIHTIMGLDLALATPEDTILAKLKWSEQGGGLPQQLCDVREIFRCQQGQLDLDYLRNQAEVMGLSQTLSEFLEESGDASRNT
jgi:hypothetical protein